MSDLTPVFDFTITREWLGGSEDINLATAEGWAYFKDLASSFNEEAMDLAARLRDDDVVYVNEDDREFIERYLRNHYAHHPDYKKDDRSS